MEKKLPLNKALKVFKKNKKTLPRERGRGSGPRTPPPWIRQWI